MLPGLQHSFRALCSVDMKFAGVMYGIAVPGPRLAKIAFFGSLRVLP